MDRAARIGVIKEHFGDGRSPEAIEVLGELIPAQRIGGHVPNNLVAFLDVIFAPITD